MNLAIFLSFKESMEIMRRVGQDNRFIEYYLKPYSKNFEKIYIFSWINETYSFPIKNVFLVPNRRNINPYLYNLFLPFINKIEIRECSVIRLMQLTPIIPAVISKFVYKIPIIATYGFIYGNLFKTQKKKTQSIIWNILERFLVNRPDKYIVTYKNTLNHLLKRGVNKKKINLLPNGVDTKIFKPINNENKKINLLFIGRFETEKNILNLAEALSILENGSNYFITLVGDGSLKKNLIAKLDIGYQIIPSVPHNQLVKYYQKSDIFLLPSLSEGYPKVLIEAMSCGLACVVGKYLGHEQIIKDRENGIVCDFNPENICHKIELLTKDKKLREKISKNARDFVLKNNDIKNILEKEITLIKSLDETS
ncbi:MAG: glycosyltransferase family 4 protein [Candidatus Paceibacterota bacterium]|jgi:glycosyltransferase involved in cell wall biosynthesis